MAPQFVTVGGKRKAASSIKFKSDDIFKKARLDGTNICQEEEAEDELEDFSGSHNGGAKLDITANKASYQFEKPFKSKIIEVGQTPRESHSKQKQLALVRKAAKPLADEVQRTKKIWERLRLKSHVPKDERQQLVTELYDIITGRIRDFVLKHDAVRAVQTAIKYSTPEQRKQIAHELQGAFAQLAEGRYAKFLIGKLLIYNDDKIRDLIIPNFYGKVRKLINHTEASWILDDIYRTVATMEQKAVLLREWYGPEFALQGMNRDTESTSDLKQILQSEPSKRGPIMNSLLDLINSLVQKRMTGFTMLHDAMLQYFTNTPPGTAGLIEFMELVKGDETGDLLKNLAFTRSGAQLVCLLFAYGTAKDRKTLLKAYRNTIKLMSENQFGYVIILTAYDVIDDTKLCSKAIFSELLGEKEEDIVDNVVAAANNPYARVSLLYLFQGLSKTLFPASHGYELNVLKEVHTIRESTSKKIGENRRQELVKSLSPLLISAIAAVPSTLTATAFGCQFVVDVLLFGIGDKKKALYALAQCANGNPKQRPTENAISTRLHISSTPFGGRMLKSLIQGGRFDKAAGKVISTEPQLGFSNALYPVIKDYIIDWATGPSSFVVLALMEASDFEEASELKRTLKKNKLLLQKAAVKPTADQEAARELKGGERTGTDGRKKAEQHVGNIGSKLLFEMV